MRRRAAACACPPPPRNHRYFSTPPPRAGTSKINYMDPRITVAWCKAVECPIEKVFQDTLRKKFPWAMSVPSTWRF